MSIDTLQVYESFKDAGDSDEQAHAKVKALVIATSSFLSREEFLIKEEKLRDDFKGLMIEALSAFNLKFEKIDSSLWWMRIIGGAMTVAFVSHWFK